MPLNSYLRQKFGGGNIDYTRDGNKDYLYNREQQSTTQIKNKSVQPFISTVPASPTAKVTSSGNEGSMGVNTVPMKMLKSKFIIASKRG